MRNYSNIISLTKNSRGVYSLDPSIGCCSGVANNKKGCYNDCYAAKIAKFYGYDFSNTVFRDFKNDNHRMLVLGQISRIGLDFIRMGTLGDPSENWEHTLKICKSVSGCNKQIVIITKHWTKLTDEQLTIINGLNICINTSVSALDEPEHLANSIYQYHRVKPFCKSVLRIVSCDFNKENEIGAELDKIQTELFKNKNIIDTVLRVNKNNELVRNGIINVKKSKFLGKPALVSKYNKKTYLGKCDTCKEMCGVLMAADYINRIPIIKQLKLI